MPANRRASDKRRLLPAGGVGLVRSAALIIATLVIALLAVWVGVALWFQAPGGAWGEGACIALWLLFTSGVLLALQRGHALAAILGFIVAFAAVLLWWHSLRPSNERSWADDVARAATAQIAGESVTLHGVRNFEWRTVSDYTVRWETRSYDLRELQSLDMITSYWEGPAIAHVMFSFGFADGRQLAFSVEIRRERGEKYNELGGFFKEFELSVIAADERDIVRVRTNVRGEDDYLYRIRLPRAGIRALFLAYLAQMNELARQPRFYNTITVNCTTLVYHMMQHIVGGLPFSYRVLLPGYLPEYVYSVGGLDQRYPLSQLRQLGRITERARGADSSASFSQDIRRGIPALQEPSAGSP